MIDILNKYLIQHKNINIPGLGTLYLERIPARVSPDGRQILPPAYTLRFDKYFDAPDKAFFTYLASQEKIPDYEAIKLYNQFAQDLRSRIKLEEQATWKEMGTFRKDDSGDVVFEPVSELLHPFEPVAAEKFIPAMEEEIAAEPVAAILETPVVETAPLEEAYPETAVKTKDRWWIYAAALALVALAILFYQLYKYGNIWEAIANHQPLK